MITSRSILPDCRLLVCLFLLQLPAYVLAEDNGITPQQLVGRMSRASHELNYDGIFIYRHGREMDTMRIIHKKGPDGEEERLFSLTGHPREVIRNRNSVTCIFPDNKAVIVEKSRPYDFPLEQLLEPVGSIAKYYKMSISGKDRIAGQSATIVTIQPNDNYRYGYQLWIDNKNSLLLKSELKNESGYPLEQIIFTKLDVVKSIPDKLLKPSISGKGFTHYDNTMLNRSRGININNWKVGWTPGGFTMSHDRKNTSGNNIDHMVYSDGVAMVSVFIDRMKNNSQFIPGASKMGAVNAYTSQTGAYQITAVGEVPPTTVEKMAISVVNVK